MSSEQDSAPRGLGTFLGVFTPSTLTILGVIMYLRFGWVAGNAGLWPTLFIVLLANVITAVTALSVSALATNMRVGVGGAYFLISRSLGLEIGGAIGLPLYLSQVFSVTLYCYGLAESLRFVWPDAPVGPIAGVFVVGVVALAQRSTHLALRLQLPIMVAVGLSLLSLFAGTDWDLSAAPGHGGYQDAGFWAVFAVFFPAVTGILAGVSLSGDLRDPEKAIPLGTLGAVLVGFLVYLVIPVALLGAGVSMEDLRADPLIWLSIAAVPALILPGLWGAILSSAIGSILGAPRTLQALATDNVVPRGLAVLDGAGEPRRALLLSGGLALLAVLLGDLNAVAEFVSLFFLTTYGVINIVAGLESLVGDPSYRPRFKVHWSLSLAGALGCFSVMMLIDPVVSIIAIVVEIGIYLGLSRRTLETTWGDMRGGVLMALARWALFRKRQREELARSWRPSILLFTSDVRRNLSNVELAVSLTARRGIVTVVTLQPGELEDQDPRTLEQAGNLLFDSMGLPVFFEVDVVPDIESGMVTVAQANGIAGLRSNTVMLGWPEDGGFMVPAMRVMRRLGHLNKSLVIVKLDQGPLPKRRRIDVWWSGRQDNGDLMLLLVHAMLETPRWRGAIVNLATVVASEDEVPEALDILRKVDEEVSLGCTPRVIVPEDGEGVLETIQRWSAGATLVFLGLGLPEHGSEEAAAARVTELVEGLRSVVLVRNSGPFRGHLMKKL